MIAWQPVMSTSFLMFAGIVLWGTSQGWFSRKLKKTIPAATKDSCDSYINEIKKLRAKILEQQDDIARITARMADLEKQVQGLLFQINRLTTELDACRRSNAYLAARLKAALDDLTACRRELAKCRAELLAKNVSNAVCKLAPENSNLLR